MDADDFIDKLMAKHVLTVIILCLLSIYFFYTCLPYTSVFIMFFVGSMVDGVGLLFADKFSSDISLFRKMRKILRAAEHSGNRNLVKAVAVLLFGVNIMFDFMDNNDPMVKFSFMIINSAYYVYIDIITTRQELIDLAEHKNG